MPRVSGVWKSNGHRGLLNNGMTTTFSNHQRHEPHIALHWHWKKLFSLWAAIYLFLFALVICLFILPAPSTDIPESPGLSPQTLLRKRLQRLPLQQASNALHEKVEQVHLEKSSKEWHPKPDHFTLFNVSSKSCCHCHQPTLSTTTAKATTKYLATWRFLVMKFREC